MARVIFLGTAGNSAVASKGLRSSGGIIVQIEDLQFHLDPGPGALTKAVQYGVNPHHTTAILVTHNHINHCNDLNLIVDAMTHSGIEHRGVVLGSKSALVNSEEHRSILTAYHQSLPEKIIPMEKSHKVGIELVEINALPTDHTDPTAIGFKLFCPKFTLSYTGDTNLTGELLESLAGSDVVIMNVPFPGNKGNNQGLNTEAVIKIISYVRPKIAVMTHFGVEMIRADPLLEAREVQRITGVITLAASDGLAIAPSNTFKAPVKGFD